MCKDVQKFFLEEKLFNLLKSNVTEIGFMYSVIVFDYFSHKTLFKAEISLRNNEIHWSFVYFIFLNFQPFLSLDWLYLNP